MIERPIGGVGYVRGLRGSVAAPFGRKNTLRIVLFGLFLYVEMPSASWVTPDPSNVLPVTVVTADVIIDKVFLKECCTKAPIDTQLTDQAASGYLATAITHPAGCG